MPDADVKIDKDGRGKKSIKMVPLDEYKKKKEASKEAAKPVSQDNLPTYML